MYYSVNSEAYSANIREKISQHHYTQSYPEVAKYCFVLRKVGDDTIRGVLLISPFSRNQARERYTNYLELSRLWVADSEPKNTESFFIGKALNYLQRHTDLDGIISYADPNKGHTGIVYKATNFRFLGYTQKSYHYEKDGKFIHKRKIWSQAKKLGVLEKVHAQNLGLEKIAEKEKLIFEFLFKRKRSNGYIYCVTLPNTKVYIGQTINSVDSRVNRHKIDAKKGSHLLFHAALRKYNYECTIEILEHTPYLQLTDRENYWIREFNSTDPTFGYNDPTAITYALFRLSDNVLLQAFDLRTQGMTYKEIGKKLGISGDFINAIIWGRARPELRMKWLEKNPDFEKQKVLTNEQVFKIFEMYDSGRTPADISKTLAVTKTYVSYVLHGKMRSDIKSKYEASIGRPFLYTSDKKVNLDVALKVLKKRYEDGLTNIAIGHELNLSPTQVATIVQGKTAKEVTTDYIKDKKLEKVYIRDDVLLHAFDLVFKELQSQADVAKILNISKSLLSQVFNGRIRTNIKEKWEAINGQAPSLKSLAQKRRMQDLSIREKLSKAFKGKKRPYSAR